LITTGLPTQVFLRKATVDARWTTKLARFARNIARLLPSWAACTGWAGNREWVTTAIHRARRTDYTILHAGSGVIEVTNPTIAGERFRTL
jgi:hypothetical protein